MHFTADRIYISYMAKVELYFYWCVSVCCATAAGSTAAESAVVEFPLSTAASDSGAARRKNWKPGPENAAIAASLSAGEETAAATDGSCVLTIGWSTTPKA